MFWIEQSIIGLIQDLTADKIQLHAEHIVYSINLCFCCGVPHHINITKIQM